MNKVSLGTEYIKYIKNERRLKQNISEINKKLSDIENAYPTMQCDKYTEQRYWDLYSDLKEYTAELENLGKETI